ncbi:unnamed protein product [Linum trigynum]|uniref:Cytochrome P450 n=1 Tax=Linum trigynum TaxID=586398 RepID=A0AAV2FAP1_9ROSI
MSTTLFFFFSHASIWDFAIALLSLFIFCSIRERITNKGPMLWPVLGIIPTLLTNINDVYTFVTNSMNRAGGTFAHRGMWMGGAHGVVTSNPSNIEHMLKTNFRNYPKGHYFRERFNDLLGDGIFNADGESWKEQRKVAKSEMHSPRFVEYSYKSMVHLVQNKLIQVMEGKLKSGESFDLQELLLKLTFDNICSVAFGVDPECLTSPELNPFARAFEEATEFTLVRFLVPPFVWKPMKWFLIGYERKLKQAVEVVHGFADEIVRERKEKLRKDGNLDGEFDLLSRVMQRNHRGPDEVSDEYLRDFCVSFILAGRDTTSVGLAWFFWLLSRNPEVERIVVGEINRVVGNPGDGEKHHGCLRDEELKEMVYLEAALSESLRLYPPVPTEMKEVMEDDMLPDGSMVKKGGRVFYCMFSTARMESLWGKDCLEFKPERWIKEGRVVSENQFKYAVFNAGPRMCLGKKFAYTQMKMVAASVLLRYSVEVVDGQCVVPKVTTTLYMKHGLLVKLKPRGIC